MPELDSQWLAKRIAQIIETPTSPLTLITAGYSEQRARQYLAEVEAHLAQAKTV